MYAIRSYYEYDTCHQDSLGIPRCGVGVGIDCTDPSTKVGMACASSADCCGLPCVYVPGSELGVQCEACHGPGKDYAKKKVMIDPDLAREKGLVS